MGTVHTRLIGELDSLPTNEWLSQIYCNRWSGILNIDGKYVDTKGYDKAIPFIYGVDFGTHDIPTGLLAPSENTEAFLKLFHNLKAAHYLLRLVICDEASALQPALARVFPEAHIQLCHNHYLENIRRALRIRSDTQYQQFFADVRRLFHHDDRQYDAGATLHALYTTYRHSDVCVAVLTDIWNKREELFRYLEYRGQGLLCPCTNNLIEGYNSHLEGRLKSIKGFGSFASAERWLNAWMLRRRFKPFTDCGEPFKHLNGRCSFEMSKRKNAPWPKIFGI